MNDDTATTKRRTVLHGLSATAGALLLGCGDDGEGMASGSESGGASSGSGSSGSAGGNTTGGAGSGSGGADSSGATTTSTGDDGDDNDDNDDNDDSAGTTTGEPGDCDPADAWATGGTASMTATACYPDPFASGVKSCALLCETTEGPCTADTLDRQDVSEGLAGLPVRLALRIIDADNCEPVEGAWIEIWHTQRSGVYSGETPSGSFCYGDDPSAQDFLYFRGAQTTDATGRVDFDTCYPGWYGGRAIHIHFRVVVGDTDYLVSQLFFDDDLNAEICTTHPEYSDRGLPDTTNTTDNIIGGVDDIAPYLLDVERMADGAMLASKVVAIRASTADPSCSAGGMGGGGPGGGG